MATSLLLPQDIADGITALVSRNPLWTEKKVTISIIANKTAGCFTHKQKSGHYKKVLQDAIADCEAKPVLTASIDSKIFCTQYAYHAKELTDAVISEVAALDNDTVHLLVTAGGDGTSQEVQTALFKSALESEKKRDVIMNKITILRLPLGTGNDGTDGHTLEETIELLKNPVHFANARAIKVYHEGKPTEEQIAATGKDPSKYQDKSSEAPWYAFNITSIGLDAFVVYMTNVMKKKLPGNFYQLCVPLSGIIYDHIFKPGTCKVEFYDKDGNMTEETTTKIEMVTAGVSGYRMYGGGHKILPDNNNVCVTPKISLLGLMIHNPEFIDGSFKEPIAFLHTAEKIKIYYDMPVLLETDGETYLLCKEHFPLIMERTEPCIRILESDSQTYDKGAVRVQ